MDGIHDLGGMHGFGPIDAARAGHGFEAGWEGRVHGMLIALAVGGQPVSGFRHAIERIPPTEYLASSYYEHWLHAIELLLTEAGTLTREEIVTAQARIASGAVAGRRDVPQAAQIARALLSPLPRSAPQAMPAHFAAGDQVRVRRHFGPDHNRCPRYVRGALGVVEHVAGPSPVPGAELTREPVYTVAFASHELWGSFAEPATVRVDLWERYLEQEA